MVSMWVGECGCGYGWVLVGACGCGLMLVGGCWWVGVGVGGFGGWVWVGVGGGCMWGVHMCVKHRWRIKSLVKVLSQQMCMDSLRNNFISAVE